MAMNRVHFRLNEQELLRLNEQVHSWLNEQVHSWLNEQVIKGSINKYV